MKISKTDYKQILDYMVDLRWQGNEFVACQFWNGPVTKEDLFEFNSRSSAQEFCDEHSTFTDRYGYLSTRSVYRCMSEALHDSSLMIEDGGLVDILGMVNKYHDRLEKKSIENIDGSKPIGQIHTLNKENIKLLDKKLSKELPSPITLLESLRSEKSTIVPIEENASETDKKPSKKKSPVIKIDKEKSKNSKNTKENYTRKRKY
ncbi:MULTISPECIES: hypothetical protein [Sphingobacterium]|uniref:hypothetical protein n=1 Tax=Sphingobacterium TaxID=28453 RepID=UPI0028A8DDE8|nr:hypothetical protein [Sphingobacterium multivorum]